MMFFCNDTATTEIYSLSLHDALPISAALAQQQAAQAEAEKSRQAAEEAAREKAAALAQERAAEAETEKDRKSTRLNSSHGYISYAVFCLKKKIRHFLRPARGSHLCVR